MRIIGRPRLGGKTWELMQAVLREPDATLLVMDGQERHRLLTDYPELRGRIFLFSDPVSWQGRKGPIFIDNLDACLWRQFGGRLHTVTVTSTIDTDIIG